MEVLMAMVTSLWFWLFGVPLVIWGASEIFQSWMNHKERMAMIERGIHPDLPAEQEKAA